MAGQNGSSRMDRIERALELLIADHELFREEHKALLTTQVMLTDNLNKLAEVQRKSDERWSELSRQLDERFAATDERINALITVVDGIIRRPPP